jgi:quaternary ammonium compound-resistance protein SugE
VNQPGRPDNGGTMSWLILLFAGLLEIVWAAGLKMHDGRPLWLAVTIVSSVASVVLLGIAMKQIPLGTSYAVWTGIGILGTFAVGAALGETVTAWKLICTAFILAGIIGLKLSTT